MFLVLGELQFTSILVEDGMVCACICGLPCCCVSLNSFANAGQVGLSLGISGEKLDSILLKWLLWQSCGFEYLMGGQARNGCVSLVAELSWTGR